MQNPWNIMPYEQKRSWMSPFSAPVVNLQEKYSNAGFRGEVFLNEDEVRVLKIVFINLLTSGIDIDEKQMWTAKLVLNLPGGEQYNKLLATALQQASSGMYGSSWDDWYDLSNREYQGDVRQLTDYERKLAAPYKRLAYSTHIPLSQAKHWMYSSGRPPQNKNEEISLAYLASLMLFNMAKRGEYAYEGLGGWMARLPAVDQYQSMIDAYKRAVGLYLFARRIAAKYNDDTSYAMSVIRLALQMADVFGNKLKGEVEKLGIDVDTDPIYVNPQDRSNLESLKNYFGSEDFEGVLIAVSNASEDVGNSPNVSLVIPSQIPALDNAIMSELKNYQTREKRYGTEETSKARNADDFVNQWHRNWVSRQINAERRLQDYTGTYEPLYEYLNPTQEADKTELDPYSLENLKEKVRWGS